jgi:hypothetical protein
VTDSRLSPENGNLNRHEMLENELP